MSIVLDQVLASFFRESFGERLPIVNRGSEFFAISPFAPELLPQTGQRDPTAQCRTAKISGFGNGDEVTELLQFPGKIQWIKEANGLSRHDSAHLV
jgi:hypothetical protein